MTVAAVAPMPVRLPVLEPPRTRGDCAGGPRPCPWTSCKWHLAPERTRGQRTPSAHTCSLDVADLGGQTLDHVGEHLGLTRERVRQLEVGALARVAGKLAQLQLVSAADAETAVAAARRLLGRHARF